MGNKINMTVHKNTMNTGRFLSFLSTLGGCKLHQSIGEFVFLTYVQHRVDLSYVWTGSGRGEQVVEAGSEGYRRIDIYSTMWPLLPTTNIGRSTTW